FTPRHGHERRPSQHQRRWLGEKRQTARSPAQNRRPAIVRRQYRQRLRRIMNLAPLKQDCGVEVVSWQAGVSKQKCGFHENDGYASTPPRIYKKRDTSASGHIDATFGDEPDFTSNISVTKTETYSDESGDCVLDCEGSASTDVTDHYGTAPGDPDASCSAEWNPCTHPNSACVSYWSSVDFYSKITIVTTATTVTTTGSGELSYDSTVTLSDEYTTSDLKASAIAKFGSATYPG